MLPGTRWAMNKHTAEFADQGNEKVRRSGPWGTRHMHGGGDAAALQATYNAAQSGGTGSTRFRDSERQLSVAHLYCVKGEVASQKQTRRMYVGTCANNSK